MTTDRETASPVGSAGSAPTASTGIEHRAMGDIHVLQRAERELNEHAKDSPAWLRAAVARASCEPIVEHKRVLMLNAMYDERAIEQVAGQHQSAHRFGGAVTMSVLGLTAAAEAALAYAGISLAIPDISEAGTDPVLQWISSGGAPIVASAVGLLTAMVTLHVGHQIKAAHRGVLRDPDTTNSKKES